MLTFGRHLRNIAILLAALCALAVSGAAFARSQASIGQTAVALPCGDVLRPATVATQSPADTKAGQIQATLANSALAQNSIALIEQPICDDTICVSPSKVAASIRAQLDCNAVGYAFFVGNSLNTLGGGVFGAYGKARTSANPPAADFKITTKMQIASTSKVLTALATMRIMGSNINKDAYLYFPTTQGWTLSPNTIVRNITVRQFISQTSGVMQYYASQSGQDFASLQSFFTQNLANPNAPYYCPGPPNSNVNPPIPLVLPNPIIVSNQWCYSDVNFGIMRLVLANAGGANSNDPQTLADDYVTDVQDKVFTPVGVSNVACKPPANEPYSLLYKFPGTQAGSDWGNLTLSCGDWGWYVSVKDYASVLVSLNADDGKILPHCGLDSMVTSANHAIGWDIISDGQGHRWLEKNGADGTGAGDLQTTSVGIYGGRDGCVVKGHGTAPIPGVAAVLFINSTIRGATYIADAVLLNALHAGTTPKP